MAETDFPIDPLTHGQRLSLGEVTLEIRHTPGHTPEAISIVVHEHPDRPPVAVLTGDTLFIGDVGRPDLLTSVGRTADSLAQDLYRSLHDQLLTLPDETLVYPAHGAGSACGKNLAIAASSTIGEQRATNYALAPMTVDAFVEAVTDGQGVAPLYFAFAADANKRDHELLDDHEPPPPLTIDEALDLAHRGAVLLDTRAPEAFASGHVRGSVNVGLDGRFAEYAGDVIRPGQQVVLLGDHGRGTEAKVRLARIGFDAVAGEVPDIEALLTQRPELARTAPRLPAGDVAAWRAEDPDLQIVDVRNPGETKVGGSVPATFPCPSSSTTSTTSTPAARPSSTAPADTAPPSRRPPSGPTASSRSPTSSAATPPGPPPTNPPPEGPPPMPDTPNLPETTPTNAHQRSTGTVLLDVREPDEWAAWPRPRRPSRAAR